MKKLIVDLNAKDATILSIMREVLDLPISTIIRWSIRHYALHGPIARGAMGEESKRALLNAIGTVTTGLFIQEIAPCPDTSNSNAPPVRRGRSRSSGGQGSQK